jgi:two-component system response regulator (stage 0 sporulation protein F)
MKACALAEEIVAAERGHSHRRLLVVDDDDHMRALMAAHLRCAGYAVSEARDGVEVIERFESTIWSERPDLFGAIVSDVEMPGRTGLDVLTMLRRWGCEAPIILVTAFGNTYSRRHADGLGAFAYLEKPIDPRALRRTVEQAMLQPVSVRAGVEPLVVKRQSVHG